MGPRGRAQHNGESRKIPSQPENSVLCWTREQLMDQKVCSKTEAFRMLDFKRFIIYIFLNCKCVKQAQGKEVA